MVVQRCSKCAAITTEFALSEEFRKAKITHHANFSALEQSAASGCDLCRLLRQYLLHDVSIAKPEDTDDPITISHFESDELFLYMSGMGCFLTLERVPQLSDTKPLHRFTGESCESDVDELAKQVIRPWIDNCFLSTALGKPPDDTHKYCAMADGSSTIPPLPTRVIDVGTSNRPPYLRVRQPWNSHNKNESDPNSAHYLILSYCWGHSNETAKTTKANLKERMEKLDVSSFPKTICDAIQLTKALGERYLFVDAVCIVQPSDGDNSDWLAEAPRMGDYYGNALCTIAATGANDSSIGCFQERKGQRFPVSPCGLSPWVTADKTETVYMHPSMPTWNAVTESPLYKRGWAIQERALSPRLLHWTAEALYWECSGIKASEYQPRGLQNEMMEEGHMDLRSVIEHTRGQSLRQSWYELIEMYSWTNFTCPSDKLVALSGIAKRVNLYHHDEYAAGLWRENLVEGLAWHTDLHGARVPSRPTTYIAPTWSWASVDAIVSFFGRSYHKWE